MKMYTMKGAEGEGEGRRVDIWTEGYSSTAAEMNKLIKMTFTLARETGRGDFDQAMKKRWDHQNDGAQATPTPIALRIQKYFLCLQENKNERRGNSGMRLGIVKRERGSA
jgi:hypothetical protein